ncbi:MAG TPA: hypothetical protein PLG99_08740, partial [Kaistiaceae bacterium]|nr:hypothetical protein [Kaistiaceae bacterium]
MTFSLREWLFAGGFAVAAHAAIFAGVDTAEEAMLERAAGVSVSVGGSLSELTGADEDRPGDAEEDVTAEEPPPPAQEPEPEPEPEPQPVV